MNYLTPMEVSNEGERNTPFTLVLTVWEEVTENSSKDVAKREMLSAGKAVALVLVQLYGRDKYKLLGQLWEASNQMGAGLNPQAEDWAQYVTEQVNSLLIES